MSTAHREEKTQGEERNIDLSQNKQNHLPEGPFVLVPYVSSDHTSQVSRRDNSLYSISKLLHSAAVISARERKSKCNLANYTLRRTGKTNKKSLNLQVSTKMQKTDKLVFLLWGCTCELRAWE